MKNGNATINTGADGLQRLDQLVATAKKYDIKLVLSLTNNWGSDAPQASTSFRRNNDDSLPRAFLSNDYGLSPHLYHLPDLRLDDNFLYRRHRPLQQSI